MAEPTTHMVCCSIYRGFYRLYHLEPAAKIMAMIPVSVIVTTYNEEQNLARCLASLSGFDEVIIVDSNSTDGTAQIAQSFGARVENFTWNGAYPKKRQWCLENIQTRHDFIFFVDADEFVTSELLEEISQLDFECAGYFIKGCYIWGDKPLNFGLQNNKLVLFDRRKFVFPVVDDLDIEGMGEMEGHYQPVLDPEFAGKEKTDQLKSALLHYAYDDFEKWQARHKRYALWEARMIKRKAYPQDPLKFREFAKSIFRQLPMRGILAFLHSYIFKLGFLDGKAGYDFARTRMDYYHQVSGLLSSSKGKVANNGKCTERFARGK
ncbi:MAG: glycosyltransferase family 2 protein [Alphaproteobacteria bacterium]|nr:glycosyltransferase family 2 protein [Alphaproteobacteria bacterium]